MLWQQGRWVRLRRRAAAWLALSVIWLLGGCAPIEMTAGLPGPAAPVHPGQPAGDGVPDAGGAPADGGFAGGDDAVADAEPDWAGEPGEPPRAKLAIVIDDLGLGQAGSDELLAFPEPLTFAVLPGTRYAEAVMETAEANGHTVLLHLPMEPLNVADNDPGPEAIYVAMTDDEIRRQTARLLDMLPGVAGVNNHMGSAATADPRVMAAVLQEVHARGLFFLDSRTTAASVVTAEAERIGLPYAANDLFLDLERTVPAVKEMVREAMRRAEGRGTLIAIAHPHPSVATALYEMLPELKAAGIALVPVTELLHEPGG